MKEKIIMVRDDFPSNAMVGTRKYIDVILNTNPVHKKLGLNKSDGSTSVRSIGNESVDKKVRIMGKWSVGSSVRGWI